jgi:hypothetical protein
MGAESAAQAPDAVKTANASAGKLKMKRIAAPKSIAVYPHPGFIS